MITSILYLTSMLTLGADYLQTRAIHESNGRFLENNAIIRHTNADIYFATAAVANTAVLLLDDEDMKQSIFATVTVVQAHYIYNNRAIGIRATVRF